MPKITFNFCASVFLIPILTSCMSSFSYINSLNPSNASLENLKIENLSNGFGADLNSISLRVGDAINIYAIKRTASGDYLDNISASWNLSGGSGSLTIAPDGKSSVFNALSVGQSVLIIENSGVSATYNVNVSALPALVVSSTKITSNAAFSYVDLIVDWSRNLAYAASRKANICADAIDFSNPLSPTLFGTIGSGTLQGCLGVMLFDNNNKLLVSSNSSNKVAVWDLTSNPINSGSWGSMGEFAMGQQSKRFAGLVNAGLDQWDVYLATRFNGRKLNLSISGAIATISSVSTYAPGGMDFNDATLLGSKFVIQSYTGVAQPINILNLDMTVNATDVTSFWNWTADSNSSRTKSFLGGDGGAFYGVDVLGNPVQTKKITFDCLIRSSDFAIQGTKEYLYTLCNNGQINVFDVTDIDNPVKIKKGQLTNFENEPYSIKVKSDSNTAAIVSNGGDFIIVDLQNLNSTVIQFPLSP